MEMNVPVIIIELTSDIAAYVVANRLYSHVTFTPLPRTHLSNIAAATTKELGGESLFVTMNHWSLFVITTMKRESGKIAPSSHNSGRLAR